jgi:hypothetical protein
MTPAPAWVVKRVLLGPAAVRRAAAARASDPTDRWMLRQSAEVRRSYVQDVVERGGAHEIEQAWMLLQSEDVRQSYVEEVLGVDAQQFE